MHTRHPASASYFDPVLGRKDEKGGERCRMTSDSIRRRSLFLNPLQRYKNILEYANFEPQKVKFFAKNLHICKKCCTFARFFVQIHIIYGIKI